MPAIEDALYARLQAVSGFTTLVSARVYPQKTENQNPTSPYVTYEVLRSERPSAMGSDPGNIATEIRYHIWAANTASVSAFDSARSVAVAMIAALKRWRGTLASTEVEDVFFLDEFTVDEIEPGRAHRVVEFRAHWKE